MRILFVHDHPFRKVGDKLYSTGGLSNSVLGRYSAYCDSLTVIARIVDENSVNNRWSLIDDPKVMIMGNNSFIFKGLEEAISSCDKMIVRLPSFMGLQALKINEKYNKPYLVEVVGCAWDALWNHGLKGKVVAPYMFLKCKKSISKAPYVLYVTQKFLQNRYPSNGKTIGCSDVEIEELNDAVETKRELEYKHSKATYKIGTIAAVDVPYKGQEYVIRALGVLKQKGINKYNYYLVGNGDNSRLKSVAKECEVEDKVFFMGGMPHENIFEFLDSIDLYVQPSITEGLPRALIEAMSRGLPTLGSLAGGIPELVSKPYLFKKKDYNSIAAILLNIDNNKLVQMSKDSFVRAQSFQKSRLDSERDAFYQEFLIQ